MAIVIFGMIFIMLNGFVSSQEDIHLVKRSSPSRALFCKDRFERIPGHTMCLASPHPGHPVSATDRGIIETRINDIRQNVSPSASNMLEMAWATPLMIEAQIWAEHCKLTHEDHPFLRFQPGRYFIGQNIATKVGSPMTWPEVIAQWESENSSFVYSSGNVPEKVSNYTQLIWAETTAVGCGFANCSNTFFYVCNFSPSGNNGNINKPYESGVASVCNPNNTNNHLCDCKGITCLNGARLDLTNCSCVCTTGVSTYEGEFCELYCIDGGDNTGCGSPPWTNDTCKTNPSTVFNCPWLCKICPYGSKNYTEGSIRLPWETTTLPTTTSPTTASPITGGGTLPLGMRTSPTTASPLPGETTLPSGRGTAAGLMSTLLTIVASVLTMLELAKT